MATQPITRNDRDWRAPDALAHWHAYHIFYHADRNLTLRRLVAPLLAELADQETIDCFYFIRYELGGPHLRLRWRARDKDASITAEALLAKRARDFFSHHPSATPVPAGRILATNKALATADPAAVPDVDRVHADNSWQSFLPAFEIERYGGPEHFAASLDLFCSSSLAVLELLKEHAESRRGWVNTATVRLVLQLAWALADDDEDFIRLTAYAAKAWSGPLLPCVQEGDLVFQRNAGRLTELALAELESVSTGERVDRAGLVNAATNLALQIRGLPRPARWRITSSHIHMTANRLGLNNPEEVYVSQIARRAVEALRENHPGAWRLLWQRRSAMRSLLQECLLEPAPDTALKSRISLAAVL